MAQGILVEAIKNYPIDSNCYLIREQESKRCILVDPSQGNEPLLYQYLLEKSLTPDYIILTHEHFDHISSVEYLRGIFDCKVVASADCSKNIVHPKKNLSLFHDQVGFSCSSADVIIEQNGFFLPWVNETITFYLTPGHSAGGLSFAVREYLFTGDTIMKGYEIITKLPGGSKIKLKESTQMLLQQFADSTTVFPGHGQSFKLSELDIFSIIKEQ